MKKCVPERPRDTECSWIGPGMNSWCEFGFGVKYVNGGTYDCFEVRFQFFHPESVEVRDLIYITFNINIIPISQNGEKNTSRIRHLQLHC